MNPSLYTVTIEELIKECQDTVTVRFRNPDPEKYRYRAGQYTSIRVEIGGETVNRAYSFSSSPLTDDWLAITIKFVDQGLVSNFLRDNLQVGKTLSIGYPAGSFTHEPSAENVCHYVLICAGSGIAPLYSILKTVLAAEPNSHVSLYYGNRREESIIFRHGLSELAERYAKRLTIQYLLSQAPDGWAEQHGRIDVAFIQRMTDDLNARNDGLALSYWISGPGDMVIAVEETLLNSGISESDIHKELFSAPKEK